MSTVKPVRSGSLLKRQIIIDATLRVIRQQGINQCNHRSVAEEAGVPLGSTTYHFKGLDELLEAAMESYLEEFELKTTDWYAQHQTLSPVDLVIRFLIWSLQDIKLLHYEYEMYAAAISRPLLRPHSLKWLNIIEQLMMKYVTDRPLVAQLLSCMIDSLLLRRVIEPDCTLFQEQNIRQAVIAILSA